ncbi:hypothetical protein GCM10020295_45680 [Streptomyces cinereospinus]
MPVPVPRQRAIPAVESGQAQAAPEVRGLPGASGDPGTEAPREEAQTEEKARTTTGTSTDTNLTLLLIEDDPGGSPIVPELLDQAGKPIRIRTARNLTEAERLLTDDVHCILLDLALPAPGRADDDELSVLRHVLELAPRTPSSPSPRPATPSAAPRRCAWAPRTTSSATSWTAGC